MVTWIRSPEKTDVVPSATLNEIVVIERLTKAEQRMLVTKPSELEVSEGALAIRPENKSPSGGFIRLSMHYLPELIVRRSRLMS
jgi:hypothetical protein